MNLAAFMASKGNFSSPFCTEHVYSVLAAHPSPLPPYYALSPCNLSFLRLFALRHFQSFAVLWTLCSLFSSFLKQDASWDHLPRLASDTPFNTAQNGNRLLAAAYTHREIRGREKVWVEKEGKEATRVQKTADCHPDWWQLSSGAQERLTVKRRENLGKSGA